MLFDMNQYMVFLYAVCRMAGIVFFNPIFGRQSIPVILKIGLSLALAVHAAAYAETYVMDYTVIEMLIAMVKEFAVGFAVGYVLYVFLAIFHVAGQLADLQMGYSMATMYDPSSNSQVSVTGNLFTIMYTLLFFITNSHLTLMAVATRSFQVVPVGLNLLSSEAPTFAIELFGYMWIYALQLALPIVVTEILVEVAVGILMKMVPNINVFVVNLQLKMIIGLIVILTLIPALVNFLGKINAIMLERVQEMIMFFI